MVLDEPTANLDPVSAVNILNLLCDLRRRLGVTIVLVEHRLEAVASVADRFIVMNEGKIFFDGDPREVLSILDVESIGVGVPKVVRLYNELKNRGIVFSRIPLSPEEVRMNLLEVLKVDRGE